MKPTTATFCFFDARHDKLCVKFFYDDCGKPIHVIVTVKNTDRRVDNRKGRYKACMTHCLELIRASEGKKPATQFAVNRKAEAVEPWPLRIHECEEV